MDLDLFLLIDLLICIGFLLKLQGQVQFLDLGFNFDGGLRGLSDLFLFGNFLGNVQRG